MSLHAGTNSFNYNNAKTCCSCEPRSDRVVRPDLGRELTRSRRNPRSQWLRTGWMNPRYRAPLAIVWVRSVNRCRQSLLISLLHTHCPSLRRHRLYIIYTAKLYVVIAFSPLSTHPFVIPSIRSRSHVIDKIVKIFYLSTSIVKMKFYHYLLGFKFSLNIFSKEFFNKKKFVQSKVVMEVMSFNWATMVSFYWQLCRF